MKTLTILLLTLAVSACSISPVELEPETDPEPQLTYISCDAVKACTGSTLEEFCRAPPADGFYCGDNRATFHVRGTFDCEGAMTAALQCCEDIDAAYDSAGSR
jgi:hypothetical protein